MNNSFCFDAESYPTVWIDHTLFIHSLADSHLGGFQFWATTNKAALNICGPGLLVDVKFSFLKGKYLEVEWLDI